MQELIDRFEAAGSQLREALRGLTDDECRARPGPGAWSIHELLIHLQDSDAVGIDRMRRVIAEENPPLIAFNEDLFMARLHCDSQDREDAVALFELGRRQMARVLRQLPAEDFQRQGFHSEAGLMSLSQLVEHFIKHFDHHFAFLQQKKERLAKSR